MDSVLSWYLSKIKFLIPNSFQSSKGVLMRTAGLNPTGNSENLLSALHVPLECELNTLKKGE